MSNNHITADGKEAIGRWEGDWPPLTRGVIRLSYEGRRSRKFKENLQLLPCQIQYTSVRVNRVAQFPTQPNRGTVSGVDDSRQSVHWADTHNNWPDCSDESVQSGNGSWDWNSWSAHAGVAWNHPWASVASIAFQNLGRSRRFCRTELLTWARRGWVKAGLD